MLRSLNSLTNRIQTLFGSLIIFSVLMAATATAGLAAKSLGTVVVIGDSLSAGFQNFSLFDVAQNQGFAALVAKQAGADLPLPLISVPGIPGMLTIDSHGNITRSPGIGSRENPTVQAYNLSVPGFTLANAFSYSVNVAQPITNPIDGMALSILAIPGTQSNPPCGVVGQTPTGTIYLSEVACAAKLHPNTILVSIGNNDALQSLTFGIPPTDPAVFAAYYGSLLGVLRGTGAARIVVANIPDVTAVPFLVPAPAFQATCHFLPAGVTAADYLVPNITNPADTNFNICTNYAIRPAALIASARSAVQEYNATIGLLAPLVGAVVVDFHGLLANIAAHGYKVGPDTLTTGFLGGLFSLDALHPTNTGYAILANSFIDEMNEDFHMNIPDVSVRQVELADPLVFNKH